MKFFILITLLGCLILVVRSEPDESQPLQQKVSENITLEISNSSINGVKQSNFSEVRSDVNNSLEEAQNLNDHVNCTNSNQASLNLETDGNTKLIKRNVDGLNPPSFSESNFDKYDSLFSGGGIENLLGEGRERSNDSEMKEKNHIYGPRLNDINENRKLMSGSQSYSLPDTNSYYNDLDHKDYSKLFQRSGNSNMNNDNRISNQKMYPSVSYEGSRQFSSVPRDDSEETLKEMQPFNELHVPSDSLIPLQMEKRSEVLLKDLEQQVDSKKNDIHQDPTISGDDKHDNRFPGSIIEKTIMNLKSSEKDYPNFGGDLHHTYNAVSFVPRSTEEHIDGKLNNIRGINLMEDDNIEHGADNNVPFEPEMKSDYSDRNILNNDYNKMLSTYNNAPFEAEMKSDYSDRNILNNDYNKMLSTYNNAPFEAEMKSDYSESNVLNNNNNNDKMLSAYNNVPFEAEMKSDYSESNLLNNNYDKILSTSNNVVPLEAEKKSDYSESNLLNKNYDEILSASNNVVPFEAEMKSDYSESSLLNKNYNNMAYNNVLSDLNRSLKNIHEVSNDYSTLHRDLGANIRSYIDKNFNEDNLPTKPQPGFVPKRTGRKRFKLKNPNKNDERDLTQLIKKKLSQIHR